MEVLQTSALPLGYGAGAGECSHGPGWAEARRPQTGRPGPEGPGRSTPRLLCEPRVAPLLTDIGTCRFFLKAPAGRPVKEQHEARRVSGYCAGTAITLSTK